MVCTFFFFSSRRRHTRSLCDWSSDVCSSDLVAKAFGAEVVVAPSTVLPIRALDPTRGQYLARTIVDDLAHRKRPERSEERRVGKECRFRGSPVDEKKKKE